MIVLPVLLNLLLIVLPLWLLILVLQLLLLMMLLGVDDARDDEGERVDLTHARERERGGGRGGAGRIGWPGSCLLCCV